MAAYEFPVGSGFKVTTGTLTFGFFLGLDSALLAARRNLDLIKNLPQPILKKTTLIKGFSYVAIATILLTTLMISLVVFKDLEWISNSQDLDLQSAVASTLMEIIFIMLVFLLLIINLIVTYARNLRILFRNQIEILENVIGGNLNQYVPVAAMDEFGRIGAHTNSMIDELKEKNKLESVLGKVVSKPIADRLLDENKSQSLDGKKQNLAIMMTDIRNFTTLSEKTEPEMLVRILNRYFTRMVAIVHHHNGIVDKFIGDGLFAVFGLDSEDNLNTNKNAVSCGAEMLKAVKELETELGMPFRIGIGVHYGEVIGGRIGAEERLEYTFVGDTVNTSARLEAANKKANTNMIISQSVYESLDLPMNDSKWIKLGSLMLKGKKASIPAYGLKSI